MEPASTIIDQLGGDTAVSRIVGVHRTRVANWKRAKSVGGTGGLIPWKHVPKLIAAAKEAGVPISADSFLPLSAEAQP